MENNSIDKIYLHKIDVNNSEEALRLIANELYLNGYVKEEYSESVVNRESIYPTGLPSTMPAIAIPHTDYSLVNKTAIAIATLKNPVRFNNMEKIDEEVNVSIILMLAIAEPKGQIEMLQKIVSLIADEHLRKQIYSTVNEKELEKIISTII